MQSMKQLVPKTAPAGTAGISLYRSVHRPIGVKLFVLPSFPGYEGARDHGLPSIPCPAACNSSIRLIGDAKLLDLAVRPMQD